MTEQKDFICFNCGQKFKTLKEFNNHRFKTKHTGYTI